MNRNDQRMYEEELALDLYDRAKHNWEEAPPNKRGTPPVKPTFPKWTDGLEEKEKAPEKPEIYPDIADVFGHIETVEIGDARGGEPV